MRLDQRTMDSVVNRALSYWATLKYQKWPNASQSKSGRVSLRSDEIPGVLTCVAEESMETGSVKVVCQWKIEYSPGSLAYQCVEHLDANVLSHSSGSEEVLWRSAHRLLGDMCRELEAAVEAVQLDPLDLPRHYLCLGARDSLARKVVEERMILDDTESPVYQAFQYRHPRLEYAKTLPEQDLIPRIPCA